MKFKSITFILSWVFVLGLVEAKAAGDSHAKASWRYLAVKSESFPFIAFDTISLQINEQGFSALDRSQTGRISSLGVDQVYADWNMAKTIFLKMNVKPSDPNLLGKIIPFLDGFLYHDKKLDVPYALYFLGLSQAEVTGVIKKMELKDSSRKFGLFFSLLFPHSNAQVNCLPKSSAYQLEESLRWPAFAQEMAACGLEGLKNAPAHLQSQARAVGSFFSDIKNDPRLIWSRVQKQFQANLDLLLNIQTHFQNLSKTITNIDFESLSAVACEVMKSTSQSLPLIFVGGGALKVSVLLAEKLKRVGELGLHLKSLAKSPKALSVVVACE